MRAEDESQSPSVGAYLKWLEGPVEVRYLDDEHERRLCACGDDVGDVRVDFPVLTLWLCEGCRKKIRYVESQRP